MALSAAVLFFDELIAGGASFIENLVTIKQHETEWLDFKGCEQPVDEKQMKEFWSEAICGFANNQGGVLIWGVDARKDVTTGVDAACGLKPVDSPTAMRTRLVELQRMAIDPPLAGVDVRAFHREGDSGPGFVVCFIPESDNKPHRAENIKNKPYKIRIGDAFIIPSVSLLRSLFFPRSSVKLLVEVQPQWTSTPWMGGMQSEFLEIRYKVQLRNIGTVSARDVFVVINPSWPAITFQTPYRNTNIGPNEGTGIAYPELIHPSSTIPLCIAIQNARAFTESSGTNQRLVPGGLRTRFRFDIFATDAQPSKLIVELEPTDIEHQRLVPGRFAGG